MPGTKQPVPLSVVRRRKYEWTLLKQFKGGHSFWQCGDLVSVCDQSGNRPHLTDDGPLWIKTDQPIVLSRTDGYGSSMYFAVPVVKETDGRACHCGAGLAEVAWLVQELGMSLQINDEEGGRWMVRQFFIAK